VPVPADPATVGAYLASLATTHAPTTIRRRLAAIGKMHRFNDLPWNPAHRAIQEPLRGVLRRHGRPVRKAAPLTLAMLCRLLATCDATAPGRRDRALLLFGFAGALRRSELVALTVDDVALTNAGLRLRIGRGKTDPAGQGAEIGLPRGRSRPGRRWPRARPGRCFAASAPPAASAIPRCIPTRCAASWPAAPRWPGWKSPASTG
jgi:integrase